MYKFFDNKRGQFLSDKFTNSIIGIAVLFFVAAALVPEAQTAGDQLGDPVKCTDAGGFFNASLDQCFINASIEGQVVTVPFQSIPLSSLLVGGGVVFILVAVVLLKMVFKTGQGK